MTSIRRKPHFWRRQIPHSKFDAVRLLPSSIRKGERFETATDVDAESIRSEQSLKIICPRSAFAAYLSECRESDYHCERTYCPRCARAFRRYLIGELLRLYDEFVGKVRISTVLLKGAPKGKLGTLEVAPYDHMLRKRLVRAGLRDVPVVGGFEVMYRADRKTWVLHMNLAIFGGDQAAIAALEQTFAKSEFNRPVQTVDVKNPVRQFSYLLKFTTYHRPFKQTGPMKSPARPLNPSEHYELISWMAKYAFTDHLFLFNARRYGASIRLNSNPSRKA